MDASSAELIRDLNRQGCGISTIALVTGISQKNIRRLLASPPCNSPGKEEPRPASAAGPASSGRRPDASEVCQACQVEAELEAGLCSSCRSLVRHCPPSGSAELAELCAAREIKPRFWLHSPNAGQASKRANEARARRRI